MEGVRGRRGQSDCIHQCEVGGAAVINELFAPFDVLRTMDPEQEKQKLEQQLCRCRDLERTYEDGITARNLREIEREVEERLRMLQQRPTS